MFIHEFKFSIGDKVTVDNHRKDDDIVGVVLAVTLNGKDLGLQYKVGWMHNGQAYDAWFDPMRLALWAE